MSFKAEDMKTEFQPSEQANQAGVEHLQVAGEEMVFAVDSFLQDEEENKIGSEELSAAFVKADEEGQMKNFASVDKLSLVFDYSNNELESPTDDVKPEKTLEGLPRDELAVAPSVQFLAGPGMLTYSSSIMDLSQMQYVSQPETSKWATLKAKLKIGPRVAPSAVVVQDTQVAGSSKEQVDAEKETVELLELKGSFGKAPMKMARAPQESGAKKPSDIEGSGEKVGDEASSLENKPKKKGKNWFFMLFCGRKNSGNEDAKKFEEEDETDGTGTKAPIFDEEV